MVEKKTEKATPPEKKEEKKIRIQTIKPIWRPSIFATRKKREARECYYAIRPWDRSRLFSSNNLSYEYCCIDLTLVLPVMFWPSALAAAALTFATTFSTTRYGTLQYTVYNGDFLSACVGWWNLAAEPAVSFIK